MTTFEYLIEGDRMAVADEILKSFDESITKREKISTCIEIT